MQKYNGLFFSVLLFLSACGGPPSGIIKEKEMANIITEIHIIDGSTYTTTQAPDSLYKYGTAKYNAMFKRYHIDSAQFRKSFKYYTSNPVILQDIYSQVIKNIQSKIDSLNHKHPKNATPGL